MEITNALSSLSALSHETRLWVFRLLVQAGPDGLSAGEIADALSSHQNTMSSHLRQLSNAGLIRREREGRRIMFQASTEGMRELTEFLTEEAENDSATGV